MSSNGVGNVDMARLVHEMRALATRSGLDVSADRANSDAIAPTTESGGFATAMKTALEQVNALQQTSAEMAGGFERGDPQVDLAAVMVASQKSAIAFQAVTEVRNRLIRAYQDVMNMPI